MTTKAREETKVAPDPVATVSAEPEAKGKVERASDECTVDDGTAHTGRAVNGKVCSAHAMHYRSDGTRRVPATAGDRAGATVRTGQ